MTYINKGETQKTLLKMQEFEEGLHKTFSKFNLDLRENTGRRNMLVSQAQEVFFAQMLSDKGFDTICSGKTGEPDIILRCIGKELECKLSSASSSSWPLQCDYSTLKKKGSIDFLYVLCNKEFDKFAVLLFEDLSINEFFPPSSGSREKSRMNKSLAMKKCKILHGCIRNRNDSFVQQYSNKLAETKKERESKVNSLSYRVNSTKSSKEKYRLVNFLKREEKRLNKKEELYNSKIDMWKNKDSQFSITLESLA